MKNTILFDLDGTLLNVDTDGFIDQYFKLLAYYFKDDIPFDALKPALNKAVYAMMSEVGHSNYDVFCQVFHEELQVPNGTHEPKFQAFYVSEFDKLQPNVQQNATMKKAFDILKGKGYRFALATNPAFPLIAQTKRLSWGGYDSGDFELITGADNSIACKPFREYYNEITDKMEVGPENCYMIGNDIDDDMVADRFGFETFLVTDNLINKKGTEYLGKQGDSDSFLLLAEELCTVS